MKTTFACPQEQLVALKFFKKFWTVLDFLQKPSAWFSKFYLRVQSKNFGRNIFLIFLFRIFRILSENFFRLSAKNLQKVVKTTFCVTRGTICGLKNFLKFWIVLDFLQKPLAWFSKFYLSVQSKKCGKNSFFLFSFQIFFDFWAKIFQTFGQKTSKYCENYLCVSTGTTCGFKIFLKVLNRFGFSAETFGMILKILSTCPE